MTASNGPPYGNTYLEDFGEGDSFELGSCTVSEAEIIAFARQFDPQPFHADPEAAEQTPFRGLIASGFHTTALFGRLLVDAFPRIASLASPGFEEIRLPHPLRPGDTIAARTTIAGVRTSKSRPEMGILSFGHSMTNQRDELIFTMHHNWFVRRRPG
jgi:acyl dehydratase